MPKGYWIADSDIFDLNELQRYREANRAIMNRFGGRFIVAHGEHKVAEGEYRRSMTVVEFPSYQAAVGCHDHPEYQEAAKIRHKVAIGNMVIVEGFDQPEGF